MDELADGLWARLRNVLIALDRMDRLETASDFVGWVESFQRDDAQIETTTRDWVLRAVRLASDPLNYQILRAFQPSDEMTIAQLMAVTGLSRVELTERVKDLAQVGFIAQTLETDAVQGTRAAEGMVAWIEALREQIAERARAGLTKDNPPPKFHRPISNFQLPI
ncbi:MAG: hypothetical protein HY782_05025 [Chloroflexi bacterium]|nr:hypothetical protein [Chloroflexota bacterium]